MFRQPIDAGAFEGDTFKGDDNDLDKVTHQWANGNWHQLAPEVAEPANMTDIADEHEAQMPGMEAIPADMPNSEPKPGDIPLEYNFQNFNALVSANTAMQTALADAEIRVSELSAHLIAREGEVSHLREVISDSLKPTIDKLQTIVTDQETEAKRLRKLNEGLTSDLTFANEQRETLQRRLDRSLGYIDRFLDVESEGQAPLTQSVPAPQPAVGPNLGSVPDAVRRNERGDVDMPYAFSARYDTVQMSRERHRRY
jgi:hypothetical protein